jgi:flagellar hook-basal body complex protein FliE
MPVNPIGADANYLDTAQFPQGGQAVPEMRPAGAIDPIADQDGATARAGGSFADALSRALGQVNALHLEADRQAELLATGRAENPHDAVLALEKADLALQLTIKVTEKAIGAYRQLSQMQV